MKTLETTKGTVQISNMMFANYLVAYNLVHKNDTLLEAAYIIPGSISFQAPLANHNNRVIVQNEKGLSWLLENYMSKESEERTPNLICNGVHPCVADLAKKMIGKGAFNIGICSGNEREYQRGKKFYDQLFKELIQEEVPVEQLEIRSNNNKIYVLSYRYSGEKK